MDFDKLKKTARETLKIVSSKKGEQANEPEPEETAGEPEETSAEADNANAMGRTQRIDLKNVLDIFKKKKFTDAEQNDTETADIAYEPAADPEQETIRESEAEIESTTEREPETEKKEPTAVLDKSIYELKDSLAMLDAKLDAAADKETSDISCLNKAIEGLSVSISELQALYAADNMKRSDLSDAILSQLDGTDKKLKNISNSISGVSKLGDSIFDLKNSQMNTKNALGDLEASFYKLKKKMNTSVLIISILTAVIAILEIINLLS